MVCHGLWKTCACVDNTKGIGEGQKVVLPLVVVCGFVVCCAVSGAALGVVLGVLVVIVAGSRPVVLFEPGC